MGSKITIYAENDIQQTNKQTKIQQVPITFSIIMLLLLFVCLIYLIWSTV